jgi:hypothetical protein
MIIIKDLEINQELDKQAMLNILGGRKNQSASGFYFNSAKSWVNKGKAHGLQSSLSQFRTNFYDK